MRNFQRLATSLSVEPLLNEIASKPNLWRDHTARQSVPGTAHRDTESIFLRWCSEMTAQAVFNEIHAKDWPALEKLPTAANLIDEIMWLVDSKELGRAMIVNLKPGGYITPHPDEGAYADHYERFHLALASLQGNAFFVGIPEHAAEMAVMKPGELWWFNHKETHWVVNQSEKPRLHLIVDAVSPKHRRERCA